MGRLGDVGQAEQARRVRLRREDGDACRRRERVDVGEIERRHRHQIAMAQHRALGPAGGAAGVEQPGEVVAARDRSRHRVGARELAPESSPRTTRRVERLESRAQSPRRDRTSPGTAAPRILGGHEGDFAGVQLGVGRHGDEAGAPDREQDREIVGIVGHRQHDAVAGLQAERPKPAGQPRRQRAIGRVVVEPAGRRPRRRARPGSSRGGVEGDARGSWSPLRLFRGCVIATAASSTPRRPPPFSTSATRAPATWRVAGFAAQLRDEFEHLSEPGRADRMALRSRPPERVEGDPAAEPRLAALGCRTAFAEAKKPSISLCRISPKAVASWHSTTSMSSGPRPARL